MGFDTSDDACVYRLREDLVMIQTVDFFTPIVDDPYLYGQIAAANALSDIYAMGASPSVALNILCIPSCLPQEMVKEILAGGYDKVHEAGAVIAGGHSIEDEEPKYGLCVSAFAHPEAVWSNAGVKPGDVLILTKPLGTGILATAARADLITDTQFRPVLAGMATLNRYARDAALGLPVNACTDITGFGFLGHAAEMAEASGCSFRVAAEAVPVYPFARKLAEEGIIPGGAYRNREFVKNRVAFSAAVPVAMQDLLYDPQTSGGLLFSVPEKDSAAMMQALEKTVPGAAIIGKAENRQASAVFVE